jgi:hypothetical protein
MCVPRHFQAPYLRERGGGGGVWGRGPLLKTIWLLAASGLAGGAIQHNEFDPATLIDGVFERAYEQGAVHTLPLVVVVSSFGWPPLKPLEWFVPGRVLRREPTPSLLGAVVGHLNAVGQKAGHGAWRARQQRAGESRGLGGWCLPGAACPSIGLRTT